MALHRTMSGKRKRRVLELWTEVRRPSHGPAHEMCHENCGRDWIPRFKSLKTFWRRVHGMWEHIYRKACTALQSRHKSTLLFHCGRVVCVPLLSALRVPLVHSLIINHFRQNGDYWASSMTEVMRCSTNHGYMAQAFLRHQAALPAKSAFAAGAGCSAVQRDRESLLRLVRRARAARVFSFWRKWFIRE